MSAQQPTLMVMAGGTGGHVYPAMAVADTLQAKGWRVVWLATEGGMENRLIAQKSYEKAMMTIQGVRGKGVMGWLRMPLQLSKALWQAMTAVRTYSPTVVLGMGGFAAFPGGVVARLLGKPMVIHEQNSIAGLTNKVLSRIANTVLTGFPNALGARGQMVGNPVRKDLLGLAMPDVRFKKHTGSLKVLVVGGSLGAAALNETVPKALALMADEQRPEVIHQAGEKHLVQLQSNYAEAGVEAECRAFIHDMPNVYQWADVVICRAGALTVAELAAVGVASVLVPFPFAVDDHQTTNAQYLATHGAAILIQQSSLTAKGLAELLTSMTREHCLTMATKARALALPNATEVVANHCEAYYQSSYQSSAKPTNEQTK